MSANTRQRLSRLVLVCALTTGVAAIAPSAPASASEPSAELELILDSSGSMANPDPSGLSKIAAAKQALVGVVDALPAEATVGLRVYGARYQDEARGCTDTQLVLPLGSLDKTAAKAALGRFKPGGYTPIAYSLQQAAKDFRSSGQRTIVLVSDGEETCHADPCAVAKSLAAQGVDLHVDTVGFGVSAAARSQLTCIAQNTGGHYYDAPDADSLKGQLGRIAVRATRPYTPSGAPIKGTLDPTAAPVMRPGQFVDTLKVGEKKHYAVDIARGVTPYVAATLVHPFLAATEAVETDTVDIGLATADGKQCGDNSVMDQPSRTVGAQTGFAAPGQFGNGRLATGFNEDKSCGLPGRYIISISRTTNRDVDRDDLPMEIVFVAEPPVRDPGSLPGPQPIDAAQPANAPQPAATGTAVLGGGSFTDAPIVLPGTSTDSIRAGETLYYRVKLDWGQRLSYGVALDPAHVGTFIGTTTKVRNPVRIAIDSAGTDNALYFPGSTGARLSNSTVPVTFRNRENTRSSLNPVSLAGYYYIEVHLDYFSDLATAQAPVRLAVRVSGNPAGKPAYQSAPNAADPGSVSDPSVSRSPAGNRSATPALAGTSSAGKGVSLQTIAFAAAGGLALLGAAGLLLVPWLRRRRGVTG